LYRFRRVGIGKDLIVCIAMASLLAVSGCSDSPEAPKPTAHAEARESTSRQLPSLPSRSVETVKPTWQTMPTRGTAAMEIPVGRKCSACGHDVGLSARVGQRCPYCRALWGFQTKVYVNSR
jgi:hypothetical protein